MGNKAYKKAKSKRVTKKLGSRLIPFLTRNTLICESSCYCWNKRCILQGGKEVPELQVKANKCSLEGSIDISVLCSSVKEG